MLELEPFDRLALSLHHNEGVYALLIGSGLSKAAGIPTGWEITIDLIRRLANLQGVDSHPDWVRWYVERYGTQPSYSEILNALAVTPSERRAILHGYIEPVEHDDRRRPTKAHQAIASLVVDRMVRVIVTTNFDRLIENALREAGVEPSVIASDDALAGATPLVHARCTVIKVHGDYLDSRIKNTDEELRSYSPAMCSYLDEVFDRFGLIVVGWSGEWDLALRDTLLRVSTRRYPLYWAARETPKPAATDLVAHRGGHVLKIDDADSFLSRLAETLAALKRASRPHPVSVAAALVLAKGYCRRDETAMEWSEFLAAEVTKIKAFLTSTEYPTGRPNKEALNALVTALLARTEVLRRAAMIGGRWGTDESIRALARSIRALARRPEAVSDYYGSLRSLRNLPSALCFHWVMLGALCRDRYDLVKLLMYTAVPAENESAPAITQLPLMALHDDWRFLAGYERQRTPASLFMFAQVAAEVPDIAVDASEANELFDRLECLISLEFAHLKLQTNGSNSIFWTVPGRYASRGLGKALREYGDIVDDHPAVRAGLLGGHPASAKAAFDAALAFLSKGPMW